MLLFRAESLSQPCAGFDESISSASVGVPMSPCSAVRLILTPVTLLAMSALKSRIEPSAISVTSAMCERIEIPGLDIGCARVVTVYYRAFGRDRRGAGTGLDQPDVGVAIHREHDITCGRSECRDVQCVWTVDEHIVASQAR